MGVRRNRCARACHPRMAISKGLAARLKGLLLTKQGTMSVNSILAQWTLQIHSYHCVKERKPTQETNPSLVTFGGPSGKEKPRPGSKHQGHRHLLRSEKEKTSNTRLLVWEHNSAMKTLPRLYSQVRPRLDQTLNTL